MAGIGSVGEGFGEDLKAGWLTEKAKRFAKGLQFPHFKSPLMAMVLPTDLIGRGLRDLRISVTDRCNFRCRYCMPVEAFGPGHVFLPREEVLTFEEMVRLVGLLIPMGIEKIRLTGGEPLLRRGLDDLVAMLAAIEGVKDLAITTNGVLLAHHAEGLALAGLNRVTVSLDALDPEIFARMNGVGAQVGRVLAGIASAQTVGLPVKVNAVIQRGVNDSEILPLARWARTASVDLRFIEYMDVGETNGWSLKKVVAGDEILAVLAEEFALVPRQPAYRGEVAAHWQHADGAGEIGLIRAVTRPFCRDCQRLRLSADGKIFTCLFADHGHDLRGMLRGGFSGSAIQDTVAAIWGVRSDRYSEERGGPQSQRKAEMSYLGG
jgi:cyclic pyranopterin phosphate synthase